MEIALGSEVVGEGWHSKFGPVNVVYIENSHHVVI